MDIKILGEYGFDFAMLGLSLSFKSDPARMPARALLLAGKDKGHNKFLESIQVWIDLKAPRFFWQEFDTYRVGISKQSEATMHTLLQRPLTQEDFEYPIETDYLRFLNNRIQSGDTPIAILKSDLPEGFLQRRVVNLNYKVIRHIILQRSEHKLPQWRKFCSFMLENLNHSEFLGISSVKKEAATDEENN